jgi:hypothetical protein
MRNTLENPSRHNLFEERTMQLRALTVGAILCLIFGCWAPAGQETWKEFQSKEGGFKVLMPGVPKEQKINLPLPNGSTIEQKQFLVDAGSVAHLAAFQDNTVEAENAEKVLESGREGAVQKLKGKVLKSKSVNLAAKYPGMEFLLDAPQLKLAYRSRMYLVGRRFYQVTVVGPMAVVTSPESDRFLESFALAK